MSQSESIARLSADEPVALEQPLKGLTHPQDVIPRLPDSRKLAGVALSFEQEQLWMLQMLHAHGATYNTAHACRFTGPLDVKGLEWSLNELVARHAALRTRIGDGPSGPAQFVVEPWRIELPIKQLPRTISDSVFRARMREEARRPFDLRIAPLVRSILYRIDENSHVLTLTTHQIGTDGSSAPILLKDLAEFYNSRLEHRAPHLASLALEYADYADWQRRRVTGPTLDESLQFWKAALADAPESIVLPAPGAGSPGEGKRAYWSLSAKASQHLSALAAERGVTIFMLFLAGFTALLRRYSGQEAVVVGTPITTRTRAALENLVGLFVNTLPMHLQMSGTKSFEQLMAHVKRAVLDAQQHSDLPFARLVGELKPERVAHRNPLFQVMFELRDLPGPSMRFGDATVAVEEIPTEAAKFDLTGVATELGGCFEGYFEYSYGFDDASAKQLCRHFENLMSEVGTAPARALDDIELSSAAELRAQVAFSSGRTAELGEECLPAIFERQAEARANAPSLSFRGTVLSYAELNRRVGCMAGALASRGVTVDSRVAICADPSADLIAAILAVWKAGAAYVPLDPSAPVAWLEQIKARSGATFTLIDSKYNERLCGFRDGALCLDKFEWSGEVGGCGSKLEPDHLAAIIFTPAPVAPAKGTMVTHRGAVNLIKCLETQIYGPDREQVVLNSPCWFYPSLKQILTLMSGHTLDVIPEEIRRDPPQLIAHLRDYAVTAMDCTPALLLPLLDAGLEELGSLKLVLVGGEPIDDSLWRRVAASRIRFCQMYSPPEGAVESTCCVIQNPPAEPRIGRPIPNTRAYVLNGCLRFAPLGVTGELFIAGAGIAWGYPGSPQTTAERFVPDPFAGLPGARMYRTGDLALGTGDGLAYAGRLDEQLKWQGRRIEPAEIERVLGRHPAVARAVVRTHTVARADASLVAYILVRPNAAVTERDMRRFVRSQLTSSMAPSAYVFIDHLPLDASARLDRLALPEPPSAIPASVAPKTQLEEVIASICEQILGVQAVSADDDFFHLGGNSLLAARMALRIQQVLDVDVPVSLIFDHPTVAGLCRAIEECHCPAPPPITPVPRVAPLPLSFAQHRLWFLWQLAPDDATYNMPATIRLEGNLDAGDLAASLRELVHRHETLRTTFQMAGSQPVQVIAADADLPLCIEDLAGLSEFEREAEARRRAAHEALRPFDLVRGPVLRAVLLRLSEREHWLLLTIHHVAADGWSLQVLVEELTRCYEQRRAGHDFQQRILPIQYADFAVWQRRWLDGERLEQLLSYWRSRLAGAPTKIGLGSGAGSPVGQVTAGSYSLRLADGVFAAAKILAHRESVSMFMLLLAAFQALLHRYSGQDDIVVGCPIANRGRPELEPLIGFFANMLALRTRFDSDSTFLAVLSAVRQSSLEAYAHQDMPFEKLVEDLQPERRSSGGSLFDVVFAYQGPPAGTLHFADIQATLLPLRHAVPKFDLTMFATDAGSELTLTFEYRVDRFEAGEIVAFARRFEALLAGACDDPRRKLSEIELEPRSVRARTLGAAFELQAVQTPGAAALECGGALVNYRDLRARAECIATELSSLGVKAETAVGILLDRSADFVAACLATMLAGGAFFTWDAKVCSPVLRGQIARLAAAAVITKNSLRDAIDFSFPGHVLRLDERPMSDAGHAGDRNAFEAGLACAVQADDGIAAVTHGALNQWLHTLQTAVPLTRSDRMLLHGPAGGWRSAVETLWPLVCGACVVIAAEGWSIERKILATGATAAFVTASEAAQLADSAACGACDSLRLLIIVGERPAAEQVDRLMRASNCAVVYGYAPPAFPSGGLEFWRPLRSAEYNIRILDAKLLPVPEGMIGDVYVSCPWARGYIGDAALTADRFRPDPLAAEPGSRMYYARDRGRQSAAGLLTIVPQPGRVVWAGDEQADLDQMQNIILSEPSVSQCAVVARQDSFGSRRLLAYIVPAGPLSLSAFRQRLRERALPAINNVALVKVTSIPLASSGRIDLAALENVPIISPGTAKMWEDRLRLNSLAQQAAVFIREDRLAETRLALSELLPRIPMQPSKTKILEQPESSPGDGRLAICDGGPLGSRPGDPATLGEALVRSATSSEHGITHITSQTAAVFQSYPELLEEAARILAGLRALGVKGGDNVLFQLADSRDFLAAFWACVLGGFTPAPVAVAATYTAPNSAVEKLCHAFRLLAPSVILCSDHLLSAVESAGHLMAEKFPVRPIGECRAGRSDSAWAPASPDQTALIVLTSGSTGAPKAVVLRHRNLLSRSAGSAQMNGFTRQEISFNWMPLDHVGGIIYFHIRDVYLGCQQIHAPTRLILEDPLLWLDLIDRYRVTITWAPNFAYNLVNDHIQKTGGRKWDLSCLRFALNGGETVMARTARRFLTSLIRFGLPRTAMHPVFGMSEISSGITYSDSFTLEGTSDDLALVDSGRPIPGVSLKIVDGEGEIVPEGVIGRLQVRGETVMAGYYGDAQATAQAIDAGGWFDTGDLAFLADGRLTLTGREKDAIIINGVNYHSHEIESVVEEVEGVERSFTAACGVQSRDGGGERLAIFLCTNVLEPELANLLKKVRGRVARSIGISPEYILPVDQAQIPKTEIGKIQHRALKDRFEKGAFDDLVRRTTELAGGAATLPDWFFERIWRRADALTPAPLPERVLLFSDASGLGARVRDLLATQGHTCHVVNDGSGGAHGGSAFCIDPKQPGDYRRILESLSAEDAFPDQVVYLWNHSEAAGIDGFLYLLQAFDAVRGGKPVQVNVVSSGLDRVLPSDSMAAEKAAILGLVACARSEAPHLQLKHIDVRFNDPLAAECIFRELASADKDGEVAFREGRRFVARLRNAHLQSQPDRGLPFQSGGAYLISGGLGGIGVEICRHLLTEYGARVLLIGRSALPARANWPEIVANRASGWERVRAFEALEQVGTVRYQQVDVRDAGALREAVGRAETDWDCPMGGAIHLAGEWQPCGLAEETAAHIADSVGTKLVGAQNLADILVQRRNTFLLCFGSVTAYLGGPLTAAYAAANRALAAWVESWKGACDVRCISWSAWDIGMSRALLSAKGTLPGGYYRIASRQGIQSCLAILAHGSAHVLAGIDARNARLRGSVESHCRPLETLSAFVAAAEPSKAAEQLAAIQVRDDFGRLVPCRLVCQSELPVNSTGEVDRDALAASLGADDVPHSDDQGRTPIETELLAIWRDLLPTPDFGTSDNFFELGGHSVLATQIMSRINERLGVDVPVRVLFDSPTIAELAASIEQLRVANASCPPSQTPSLPSAHDVDQLSDNAVDQVLQDLCRASG